jgi:MinD-like ATPase involved in chromosome partitioning or flagellar assembly
VAKIIVLHSFKGGAGRSNLTACLAALMARGGVRVGVIDSDTMSSCIQILVGKDVMKIERALQGLAGPLPIQQIAYNLTSYLGAGTQGQLFIIPKERIFTLLPITDASVSASVFRRTIQSLSLDAVLIDAPSGLNEQALLSVGMADVLLVVMRPDSQDYQGTAVMIDIARSLEVPRVLMIVNEVPAAYDLAQVKAQIVQTYQCEVCSVLLHSNEMMALGSAAVFSLRYPDHPITHALQQVAVSMLRPQ